MDRKGMCSGKGFGAGQGERPCVCKGYWEWANVTVLVPMSRCECLAHANGTVHLHTLPGLSKRSLECANVTCMCKCH